MAQITETIGHDGKKNYQKRVYIEGKQRMITADSKRELADKEKALWEQYHQGRLADGKMRLAPFMEGWLERIRKTKAPSTYASYRWHYERHIKDALGNYLLAELRPRHVQAFIDSLPTPDKRDRCKRILHAALEQARRQELCTSNPADALELPPLRRKPARAWELEHAKDFLQAAADHAYAVYFHLALRLPCRPSEVLGLRWDSVDLEAGTLEICEVRATYARTTYWGETKTPKSRRTFALDPDLVAILRRWEVAQHERRIALGRKWKGDGYVCTGPEGAPLSYRILDRAFRRLVKALGLPPLTLYQLRHTVISLLFDNRVDEKVVSELAGHSSSRLTRDIYEQTRKRAHKLALATLGGQYAVGEEGAFLTSE